MGCSEQRRVAVRYLPALACLCITALRTQQFLSLSVHLLTRACVLPCHVGVVERGTVASLSRPASLSLLQLLPPRSTSLRCTSLSPHALSMWMHPPGLLVLRMCLCTAAAAA